MNEFAQGDGVVTGAKNYHVGRGRDGLNKCADRRLELARKEVSPSRIEIVIIRLPDRAQRQCLPFRMRFTNRFSPFGLGMEFFEEDFDDSMAPGSGAP